MHLTNSNCSAFSFTINDRNVLLAKKSNLFKPVFRHLVKLGLLVLSLLIVTSAFAYGPDKKPYRAHWANDDNYMKTWYDTKDGSLHVKLVGLWENYDGSNMGWLDFCHVYYSTEGGNNLREYYYVDYNVEWNKVTGRNVTKQIAAVNANHTFIEEGSKTWVEIILKDVPYNSKDNKVVLYIDAGWGVQGVAGDIIFTYRDVPIPQPIAFGQALPPTYQFVQVRNSSNQYEAKARITYSKSDYNDADKGSKLNLLNNRIFDVSNLLNWYLTGSSPWFIGWIWGDNTNRYVDAPLSNSEEIYLYNQSLYGGQTALNSPTVTVPAFAVPKKATAAYDTSEHKVTFSWTIDAVSGNNFINDRFKMEVADNPNFTNATYVSVDYDPDQTTYSYTMTKNFSPHMYFRVARDRANWNWELAKRADIIIPFNPTNISPVGLYLKDNKIAKISWKHRSEAWVPGASFVIVRTNQTYKTQVEIKLSEAEYKAEFYEDDQVANCNKYTYTLQVVPPPNSGFTTLPPVMVQDSVQPTQIGVISNLTASKGYFPDRTELRWTSKGGFDNFIIKRSVYGTNNYVQLTSVNGSGSVDSDLSTEDTKGTPGVYYTYMVVGMVTCNGEPKYSKDTLYAIGFRSPTGNVYGRVTYASGQSVENVGVRVQSIDNTQLGQSIYLNGNSESYLRLNSPNSTFTDSAFTVETWIKPADAAPKSQVIFSKSGQYELGFNSTGQLYFNHKVKTVTGTYSNQNLSFVHVAGIHTKDSLLLMLNDSVVAKVADQGQSGAVEEAVYIGRNKSGNNFKGYIDEMRVWNIGLSAAKVERDYTRMLTGNEPGLVAYWRFDETVKDQFYDLSNKNGQYNQNDGVMNTAFVSRVSVTPTLDQLSLKSYTDSTGNYMVSGIPYTGNGTTYAIVPLFGTHQFDPVSVNRFFSAASSEFTADFKDKSSFPVSGFVYYRNGTVPVAGVLFKIDGQYAQQSNGSLIETDANGKFTISVPVGTHEVVAVKNNHTFVNGGKLTDRFGQNLNYQAPVSSRVLYDSTTIRFIGRVAGGAVEEARPLGHSLSANNLGKEISITMALPTGAKYELNAGGSDSTVIVKHLLPSSQTDTSKTHKSRVTYSKNSVVIYPDAVTGEFAADLIPEKFIAGSVNVTGWGDILNGSPVTLDFSNKFLAEESTYKYKDSTQKSLGEWIWIVKDYSDTVKFNASYKFIKRVTPSVSITQTDNNGKDLPYFGDSVYMSSSIVGKKDTIPAIKSKESGIAMYIFGNPVFTQNDSYIFKIKAFEEYPFYEGTKADGTPIIAQKNGKDLIFNVPTQDGHISIYNKIKNGTVEADTMRLSPTGIANYKFSAGDPDIAAQGLKDFSATIQFGAATNINWNWYGAPQMKAYIMGGKMKGTDFITAGPNKIIAVLRDPPGSRSYSYIEKGSTISRSATFSGGVDQSGDEEWGKKMGFEMMTFAGLGAGVINSYDVEINSGLGLHHEEHYTHSDTRQETNTITTHFQTSDDPTLVGAPADVFVGYSTNITYGATDNVTIIKRSNRTATDETIYQKSDSSTYLIVKRTGLNFGQNFGTLFAYPQQHIEKVLIPNLINIRNSMLLPSTIDSTTAQEMANTMNKPIYVSRLSPDSANYGKSNNDVSAFGATAKLAEYYDGPSYKIYFPPQFFYSYNIRACSLFECLGKTVTVDRRTDTIMTLNQHVDGWKHLLADNEKAKLSSALLQNYSFHSGNPIEYSEQTSHDTVVSNSYSIIVSASISNSSAVSANKKGFEFSFNESAGVNQSGDIGSSSSSSKTIGFTLAADGNDNYFSVDVNKASGDGSFVFRTKGGQSSCPYAGETLTKYHLPGTVLDQPTVRIEVPRISVENGVVNNIPSSRKASYKLLLRNNSEAQADAVFILSYVDNDSVKGATIAVDGTPIGGSGRSIIVPYGKTVTKELTLTKGANALDYNNIMILLHSGCQYDPTGDQELIADTALISAHFIPFCSDIHLKLPVNKWVVNTASPVNANGKRYLPVTIDQFDVNNSLFDHIELQYKSSSSSTWITAMKFYSDSAKFKSAQGDKMWITNAQGINYNLEMDDASFNDQEYDIQAVSICNLGPGSYVTTESNLVSGIKDTYNPRLFGSPQPANGVLGISDEIRLNFNEKIASGLLNYTDFQVTGIRNGVQGDHTVSVKLDGQSNYLATEFEKNLAAKSITTEMWILPNKQETETVFSQGNLNESMELSVTADNRLEVTIGKKVLKSDKTFTYKKGEWVHVAMVYNAVSKSVSAFYNFTELIHNAPADIYSGVGHFEFGRSISKQGSFFNGKMHEARIWEDTLTAVQLQINSLTRLSGGENNLLDYYPMNEGKGDVCFDKAHGSNAKLAGLWSTPAGKAVKFSGNGYTRINTAFAPVTAKMDYTLELWFKADASQADAALASSGKGDGNDAGGSSNLFYLGFENGLLTYQNNGFKIQAEGSYLDNKWHHLALAVNRTSGSAQILVDGLLKKYFDAKNLGGMSSAYTYLGVRAWHTADSGTVTKYDKHFNGYIDEFRIWNTYLGQTLISNNNNIRLNGNELGLLAYYPFDKYFEFQNNKEMGFTLSDVKVQNDVKTKVPDAVAVNTSESDETAPIKDRGPVENLMFDYVVNNDAIIINMLEPKQAIDKTIVTFRAKNVRDVNGNSIVSPITWAAYIDRNQLKWSDIELTLAKDVYAPMQFESYILNSGGNVQHFRLDNIPQWLKAEPATGTVDPMGRQKITFTVNEGLNVGAYDEVVFMRNDNNESEALKVNVKVKAKQPDWKVNPADFKYSMNVFGKIRVNNIFSADKEDLLAAFANGKCVGVANNLYHSQSDFWYVTLTVYSDTVVRNNLEFRIWQANTGKTYQATSSVPVSFINNQVIGTSVNPVIFDGKEIMLQDISLNQNWNWLSFNLTSLNFTNINSTLANGRWTSGDIVKSETAFNQYASSTGSWLGTLSGFNNTSLFILKTGTAQTLSITGTAVDVKKTPIPVKGGKWNYISYLPQVNTTVKDALAGYDVSDGDVIKSQTGFTMYSTKNGWVGNLTYLEPGKGYMLYRKAATDTSFYYPSLTGSLTNRPNGFVSGNISQSLNSLQSPVPSNYAFAGNMTVVAICANDFSIQPGDNILAFVGGELRGKARAMYNNMINAESYLLNVGGEEGQSVYFMVERAGELIAQADTRVSYATNSVLGTLTQPFVLHFKKESVSATVYPNPFSDKVSIKVDLKNEQRLLVHAVQIAVYDLSGRLVYRPLKESISTNSYQATWNGKNLNGSDCAPGVYFISITVDDRPYIYKVVKQ